MESKKISFDEYQGIHRKMFLGAPLDLFVEESEDGEEFLASPSKSEIDAVKDMVFRDIRSGLAHLFFSKLFLLLATLFIVVSFAFNASGLSFGESLSVGILGLLVLVVCSYFVKMNIKKHSDDLSSLLVISSALEPLTDYAWQVKIYKLRDTDIHIKSFIDHLSERKATYYEACELLRFSKSHTSS